MMAECCIGNLRALQKEFTANDLVTICSRTSHIAEALEQGDLVFKGNLAKIYDEEGSGLDTMIQQMLEKKGLAAAKGWEEKLHVGRTVDYSSEVPIAAQLWPWVKQRYFQASKEDSGLARILQWLHGNADSLVQLDCESLDTFAAAVRENLLHSEPEGEACDEDVDIDPGLIVPAEPLQPQHLLAESAAQVTKGPLVPLSLAPGRGVWSKI